MTPLGRRSRLAVADDTDGRFSPTTPGAPIAVGLDSPWLTPPTADHGQRRQQRAIGTRPNLAPPGRSGRRRSWHDIAGRSPTPLASHHQRRRWRITDATGRPRPPTPLAHLRRRRRWPTTAADAAGTSPPRPPTPLAHLRRRRRWPTTAADAASTSPPPTPLAEYGRRRRWHISAAAGRPWPPTPLAHHRRRRHRHADAAGTSPLTTPGAALTMLTAERRRGRYCR